MKYLEVIQKHGKLTNAQVMANEFYTMCDDTKYIDYSDATASILVKSVDTTMMKLLNDILENYKYVDLTFFPKDEYIEIWFC